MHRQKINLKKVPLIKGDVRRTGGFTLVELIVVITILAILGTIAFISLQGYSTDARDSTRLSDLSSMKSTLELFHLDAGKYPAPTSATNITYSGAVVWSQGTFGETVYANVSKLDKIPKDPVTDKEYTYSVINTQNEFELGGIMEGDSIAMSNEKGIMNNVDSLSLTRGELRRVSAATAEAIAYTSGNYNGTMAKSLSGNTCNVLSIPTIITNDTSVTDLQQIVTQKKLVYSKYKNLPSSFKGSKFKHDAGFDFTTNNLLAYTDASSCTPLTDTTSYTARVNLLKGLKDAYSGSIVQNEGEINNISALTINTNSPSQDLLNYAANFVNNTLGSKLVSGDDKAPTVVNVTPDYVFGTSSPFTTNWNSNPCVVSNITKVTINPGDTIPATLATNTVYLVKEGSYNVSAMTMNACSALIGEGNVTLVSNGAHTQTIDVTGGNTVISNIDFDGNNSAIIGLRYYNIGVVASKHNHTIINSEIKNFTQFGMYNVATYYMTYKDITTHQGWYGIYHNNAYYGKFTNIKAYNHDYGVYLHGSIYNDINNIIVFNNVQNGLTLQTNSSYVTINNFLGYNNGYFAYFNNQGWGTFLNNAVAFNNGFGFRSEGIGGTYGTIFNNVVAFSNNVGFYYNATAYNNCSSYNNTDWGYYSYNDGYTGFKYYGTYKNYGNSRNKTPVVGTGSSIFADGTYDTSGTFSNTVAIIPSVSGWNSSLKERITGLTFNGNETFTFGSGIPKQTRPVKDDVNTNIPYLYGTDGVDYNTSKYIGEW